MACVGVMVGILENSIKNRGGFVVGGDPLVDASELLINASTIHRVCSHVGHDGDWSRARNR